MNNLFLSNKYTNTYYNIINNASSRLIEGYTEKHHIIPKSLGGDNSVSNLVKLTAREHFICHWLLTKMVTNENHIKMLRSLSVFQRASKTRKLTPRQYEIARKLTANVPAWNKGKTINDYTPAQQEAMRKSGITKQGRKQPVEANAKRSATLKNRTFSDEHLTNLSKSLKGRVSPTKGMIHPKKPCPYCNQLVAANIMARNHGNRCKLFKQ